MHMQGKTGFCSEKTLMKYFKSGEETFAGKNFEKTAVKNDIRPALRSDFFYAAHVG